MKTAYVMAVDAGTGSGRAIIYNLKGEIVGSAQEEWTHPAVEGVPGGLDFTTGPNGDLLDRVIGRAIVDAGINAAEIAAVSTTSMREGIVLYDEAGEVLWACPNVDGRAQVQADALTRAGISDEIYRRAGDWVSITAPARLHWLRDNRPDLFGRVHKLGMISDWMATRLTDTYVTEPTAGSSSALFDLSARVWSGELIERIGLNANIVPPVVETGTKMGKLSRAAAARCGLIAGTPVVAGGGDTQLALLGLGRRAGQATLVGGSFWQMTILSDDALIDPAFGPRTLCHARSGEWMVEGIGFLSGFALRWVRDAFFEPLLKLAQSDLDAFALIEKLAQGVPVGAAGTIAATACPMQSDAWRQPPLSFLGLDLNAPGRALGQVARSVMEAGAFLANHHLEKLEALSGQRYDTLQFTGGSSQGTLWPQIVADVTGREIEIPEVKETTALGCAMLAAVGAGLFATIDEAVDAMASPIERRVVPNPENVALYQPLKTRWSEVIGGVRELGDATGLEPIWRPAGARNTEL
ncbi:FGGY family carbohydrate kinase [Celeribacter baekdonensis]|uniref:FGGY family carbohydrate kinase n=1 Tax=Celeribacter baekdonensis TaxID=875171 RepID=UPI0030DBAA11|tara:strand:- start:40682 stop:42253 length:1572 start_codon:yes stop_codon:yes gene_type:complete